MANNSPEHLRHSLAHLLGAAVLELYPDSKLALGPSIENGFYYDIDAMSKISDDDLPKIEKKMREILKTWEVFEEIKTTADEAKQIFADNPYKLELINELEKTDQSITIYYSGPKDKIPSLDELLKIENCKLKIGFVDLCRGGHVVSAKAINPEAFKLSHIAGAYWRGDEKNPQLTRIYGLAFATKKELDEHLAMLEEAKKRDHRILAQRLDLFSQHNVSPGAIFWHPKGMVIWKELEKFIREKNDRYGYGEVQTPIMVKKSLYEISGHWDHYREDGFWFNVDEETFVLKPMNCPEATLIYAHVPASYRDLSIRLSEPTGRLHRNELKGVLGGLFRVRQFTQDDAHIFCRPDQIEEEVSTLLRYTKELYETFGLPTSFRFATKPDNAMGDSKLWEEAESSLEEVLKKLKLKYELKPKDGAFYGPKIDIQAKDAIGREHQLATIQLDFQMPERFKLEYVDGDGTPKRPVMIHRAIFGSFERFIAVLIEHYAGAFPVWLSPIQVTVLPITEKQNKWAESVHEKLKEAGIRTEVDMNNETLGKKIRQAELQKVPYLLIVGEKEVKAKAVAVRQRGGGRLPTGKQDIDQVKLDKFVAKVKKEIANKN